MKKTLLFAALIATSTFFAQTNLVLNGSCDDHTGNNGSSTTDNADAWDMTPNSTVINESGVEIDSPYRAIWYNSDLDAWLGDNTGDSNDQPGSASDGNWDYSAGADAGVKTRGVKLYSPGRRLYQVVAVTAGKQYTFSMDSRSEAENVPSEVFILNTEIASETGLTSASTAVDAYKNITNDFNASKSDASTNNFTKTSIDFTASGSFVVIYVRATRAINSDTEVFYDNMSLVEKTATASVNDIFSSKISVYPNPAKNFIQITSNEKITGLEMFNLIGKKVLSASSFTNDRIDTSKLSKGVYILKVTSNDLVGSRKVIIE